MSTSISSDPFTLQTELYSNARRYWPCSNATRATQRLHINNNNNHGTDIVTLSSPNNDNQDNTDTISTDPTTTIPWSPSLPASADAPIRCILCQYDSDTDTVVVYQAFNHTIADYAVKHQKFAGCSIFSPTRMTWIKPNFLWMQYRCGWATKDKNQQRVLAIWVKRTAFEDILLQSIESFTGNPELATASKTERIVCQWDPDHTPHGDSVLGRRAIQLGLKGRESWSNGQDYIAIRDVTNFVTEQYQFATQKSLTSLQIPIERVYIPHNPQVIQHLKLGVYTRDWYQQQICASEFDLAGKKWHNVSNINEQKEANTSC